MYFQGVRIRNFRNLREIDVSLEERCVVIIGGNAQGKSNLLEALFLLARGTSPRRAKDAELIRFGEEGAFLYSKIFIRGTTLVKELLLRRNGGKEWRINGKRISRRESVWLVGYFPEDTGIVGGAPRSRREFLDESLSFLFPTYYQFLKNYEKVVERRNILLREGDSGKIVPAYTERMIALGAKIVEWRVKYIRALMPLFQEIYKDIFGENEPELRYRSEGYSWEKGIEQGLREAGEILKNEEREKGMTLFGPHRDEILLLLGEQEVRDFASQGEKKGIALSLRMAEMEIIRRNKDDRVVVLLDDLFSEFDEKRQSLVLRRVGKEGQVFITTTEKRRAEEAVNNFGAWGFWMENGKMERWC